jgi:membrane-associated phospholipid phosphatase
MAKAHTLVDNFGDDALDTARWGSWGTPAPVLDRVTEVNGRVEIRPVASTTYSTGNYYSLAPHDLRDSSAYVELVRPLRAAPGTGTFLTAAASGTERVMFYLADTRLRIVQQVAGTYTDLAVVPYDAVRHRWLRLREAGGTTYWDASPDGTAWTTLWRAPTPIDLSAVTLGIAAETTQFVAAPGVAVFDNFNAPETSLSRRVEQRRRGALSVRTQAAAVAAARRHDEHANNNDEANYPDQPLIGNYSKGLRHDALGDPEPGSYGTLLRALQSEDPADFEEITLGVLPAESPRLKLTNPQAGLAFDIEGPDAQERTLPPAPRFDSEVAAHEMGELYWMAVARDVPFASYGSSAVISDAISSLVGEFPQFGGTVPVTVQNVFRGIYPGEQVGPYVSQFLLRGNVDPRKGLTADDGFISYGARVIDQRLYPAEQNQDYLVNFTDWLFVQNGSDTRGDESFNPPIFIRSLRDGATFVHFDQVVDAFYNAAWILTSEPRTALARPQIDLLFEKDPGNPYDPPGTALDSRTQGPFATFGPPHLLQVLSEVLGRALRAVWWQKWGVHRRLRPEEYGGRVHNHITGARTYPLHDSLIVSLTAGGLAPYYGPGMVNPFASGYLLPQAYPEGAPTHPAYGAGHATGAGACATILKAFFDESVVITDPLQANAAGTALVAYTPPPGEPALTVGGELNKLAGNIALFRDAAGVHWRSDYTESLPFGEAIAIGLLQEMSLGFNEDDAFFELTKFDGQTIRIFDGKVEPVVS